MNASKLPRVLRDENGRLPGDPLRAARLKDILRPIVLKLWSTGDTSDCTDQEIEQAIGELVDEEIIRRLAEEFANSNSGLDMFGKSSRAPANRRR